MTVHELRPRLHVREYRTASYAAGPLLFIEQTTGVAYGETVDVVTSSGEIRRGEVLEVDRDRAVVQVFGGTRDLDLAHTTARFRGEVLRLGVGTDLIGRVLDGAGEPVDDLPPPAPEAFRDVNGLPINPVLRDPPAEFVQTGVSAIDVLNTLVRGQKLPIFSGFGLPAAQLATQIAAHATAADDISAQVVVFVAVGITHHEAAFHRRALQDSGALEQAVVVLNLADAPAVERLLAPRLALTEAEFLAFDRGLHVLVIISDMTNYCEALREVATAREEMPGRRGFPGYMYTDLASIYERAGRIRGHPGSLTQLIVLSHARRRHHPSRPGPHRLHHGGADRALPRPTPPRHLPPRLTCCPRSAA